jgi:hypothetical protein
MAATTVAIAGSPLAARALRCFSTSPSVPNACRTRGAEVVFLTGSELSLMTAGILPGDTLADRAASLADPHRLRPLMPGIRGRTNELLRKAVDVVRPRFGGTMSYASIPLDGVDWTPFDIISTDAGYRTARMAARFREDIRAYVAQGRAQGKPVAITEFGCAAHSGAADMAGRGISDVIEWDDCGRPLRLNGNPVRDEDEQARYITELLNVFDSEGVDSVFLYTFARYDLVDRSDSREDFDMASAGIVRVLDRRAPGPPVFRYGLGAQGRVHCPRRIFRQATRPEIVV